MTSVRCPHGVRNFDDGSNYCEECNRVKARYGVKNPAAYSRMTAEEFKERFCTTSRPEGSEILLVVEIERLRAENEELKRHIKVLETRGKYRDALPPSDESGEEEIDDLVVRKLLGIADVLKDKP